MSRSMTPARKMNRCRARRSRESNRPIRGDVYVTDTEHGVITKFEPSARTQRRVPVRHEVSASKVKGIVVDSNGASRVSKSNSVNRVCRGSSRKRRNKIRDPASRARQSEAA